MASEDFLTKPGKPGKPTVAAGSASGELKLTASVTGSGTISKWQYKRKVGTGSFDQNWSDISNSGSTSLSHTFTGLTDGTNYQYKVRAVNATGESAESAASTAVAPLGETLTASSVTHNSATLTIANWSGDWYHKRTTPSTPTPTCSSVVSSPTKTASLSSLSGNTDYTWKAYSDSNCTNANELASEDFLTEPGQPGKPTVTAGSASGELKLTASVTGSGTISKWQYKRKVGTGSFDQNWSDISNSGSTSLSHTFTGLTDGTNYQYKVRAVNATGESAESAASTAVAPLGETLTASGVTHNSATLTIANWSGDWYHKRTTPSTPTPTCSSVVSSPTKTASLSSLSGNTDYTWKAYSDSGCTNANELASEDFLTKPGKPGKPTVAAGSGGGQLTITASVTGNGTISKWQYQQKTDGSFSSWTDIASSASKNLNHTFTGLTGSSYQFKVRAVNATGASEASDASDAQSPPRTKPGKPTVDLVPKGNCFIVRWTAPDDGGSPITGYKIHHGTSYSRSAGASVREIQYPHSDRCISPNGHLWAMRVTASNAKGSTDSDIISWTMDRPVLTATPGGAKATLSITQMANAPWWYKGNQQGATCTKVAKGTASAVVSSLTVGTAYTYGAYYEANCGSSWTGGSVSVTFTAAAGKPFKPTNVTATRGDASVALGWTSGGDGGSAITKWQYLQKTGSTWAANWTDICTSCPNQTSHTVSSLTNGTTYQFKVRAVNAQGDGAESDESASVVPAGKPSKPAKPTVAAGYQQVVVSSSTTSNKGSPITKWQYKKKTGNSWDSDWTDVANTGTSMSVTVTGLTTNSTYRFKVRAVNEVGASDESDESDAATPEAYDLTVEDRRQTAATLRLAGHTTAWYYSAGDGSCTAVTAGTSTVTLSLTANTSYTYAAYSDAACTTANKLDDVTFSTLRFWLTYKTNTTATLELQNWSTGQTWSYRKEYPSGGPCTSTTASSVDLSNLTENQSYTYTAHRGPSCGTQIGVVYFKTTPAHGLFVENITATTATLRLDTSGAQLAWRYKKTAGPGTSTCTSVSAGTNTADLTGLTSEESYTYEAYRNSCSAGEKIDDVTFATKKPAKPATPTATAGIEQVTLTSSITSNDGPAVTKWQYQTKTGNTWGTNWTDVPSSADSALSTTIKNLVNDTTYRFKVRAVNNIGTSDESDESNAATPRAATLTASNVGTTTAILTIGNYSGAWYYLANTAPDNSCKGPVSSGTASKGLTGLSPEHELHLQGLQRQRLFDGVGDGCGVPDPAAEADRRKRQRGRGQRQTDPGRLGDRHRDAEQVAVQAEAPHRRLRRGLDRHLRDLDHAEPRRIGPDLGGPTTRTRCAR